MAHNSNLSHYRKKREIWRERYNLPEGHLYHRILQPLDQASVQKWCKPKQLGMTTTFIISSSACRPLLGQHKFLVTQTWKVQSKGKKDSLVLDEKTTISLKVQEELWHSEDVVHIKTKDLCSLSPQFGSLLSNMSTKPRWMHYHQNVQKVLPLLCLEALMHNKSMSVE